MSELFYQELASFTSFDELTQDCHFRQVPEDWGIFITDIKGSTKAIDEGRYKDVNTLGVASIVATQNAMEGVSFPYVFGGDGATFVIPSSHIDQVKVALDGVRQLATENFDMELRVGLVTVGEIQTDKHVVEVAKFEIENKQTIAIFRGGGLTAAEECIKGDSEKYDVKLLDDSAGDLSGLSCRWNPIPSKFGKVVSLLVQTQPGISSDEYEKIITKLSEITGGSLENANPINLPDMTYRTVQGCVSDEKRYHRSLFSFKYVFRFLEICAAVLIFKFKIPPLIINPKSYSQEMRIQSDYRKFDDMLRLILDCSERQVQELMQHLDGLYKKGKVYYGIHISDTALMTCFVKSVVKGDHFHFVDGGDGGYAMAAKQLKRQMKG